ncbi:MAG: PorT family protein [Cyclobacteriaceae bacterium]|nr:PorT family protein [Cyclobacteriaceae bacterium]
MTFVKVALAFALLCGSLLLYAQPGIELHGGLTSSVIKVKAENGNSSSPPSFVRRYSFHLGLLASFPVSELSAIETGLYLSSRGTTVENNAFWGFDITLSSISINYIEVPFLFTLEPGGFKLFAGPQYSILASAKAEGEDIKRAFETGNLELRYGFAFQANKFGGRLSFINGLTDIYKNPEWRWKNNAYTISITYALVKPKSTAKSKKSDVPHRTLD